MLISHEVPLSLLEESRKFNDYDYCLLHLTYSIPEYEDFYKTSVKMGRKVLLDNSLYELGDALTNEQLAQGVLNIKPTWYVVPDCFNDAQTTIERYLSFEHEFKGLPGIPIGVVHGKTKGELFECYKFMKEHAEKIAIPFGSAAYDDYSLDDNLLLRRSVGRIKFVQDLMETGLFDSHKPHHLLGCNLPWEFSADVYKDPAIESLDTSNPITSAIDGVRYPEDLTTLPLKKSVIKMCDIMQMEINRESTEYLNIKHNVEAFRKMCS